MIVLVVGDCGVATSAGDAFPGDLVDLPEFEGRGLIARRRAVVPPPQVTADASPPVPVARDGKPGKARVR